MDQLMIKLDQNYSINTRVTFIGQQNNEIITGDDVAREAGLPRSEVFCSFTNRVPRLYIQTELIKNAGESLFVSLKLLAFIVYLHAKIDE
jgi:alanine racemase